MWISLPFTQQEIDWIERLNGTWRVNKDNLYRKSGAEIALLTTEMWSRWGLPEPPRPILSFSIRDLRVVDSIISEGATWASPIQQREWGVEAGFIQLPSGVLMEIVFERSQSTSP